MIRLPDNWENEGEYDWSSEHMERDFGWEKITLEDLIDTIEEIDNSIKGVELFIVCDEDENPEDIYEGLDNVHFGEDTVQIDELIEKYGSNYEVKGVVIYERDWVNSDEFEDEDDDEFDDEDDFDDDDN